MLPNVAAEHIRKEDALIKDKGAVRPPHYEPLLHYLDVAKSDYYSRLVIFRHIVKLLCDSYMIGIGAKNIDLFMLTSSISSPMGPGSDSEGIPIQFGNLTCYLTDSSQFGFEPIVMNEVNKAYCYLPSLRGEEPDKRHLNQFYHCEIEIKGDLEGIIKIAEDYVRYLCSGLLECPSLVMQMSSNPEKSLAVAKSLANLECFKRVTFDEACELLKKHGKSDCINSAEHGRDINSAGELALMQIINTDMPIWLTNFDRDRVPFYQKPDPENPDKVLNADLLFPPITDDGFGGEILGAGQRQDTAQEMDDSLTRQGLNAEPYEWYIDLRNHSHYTTTAGFGLGIERYIAWILGLDNIQNAILYPRLKNVHTTP